MTRPTRTLALTALALTLTAAGPALAGKPPSPPSRPSPNVYHGYNSNHHGYNTPHYMPQQFGSYHVNTYRNATVVNYHNYDLHYGVKFDHGFYYRGFYHNHWSMVYFHAVYGVRVYFDPYTLVEYYWCKPDNCFYPVTYVPYGTYIFS